MARRLRVEYEGGESDGVTPRGNEHFGYPDDPAGNLVVRK